MATTPHRLRRVLARWSDPAAVSWDPGLLYDPWCAYCGVELTAENFSRDHIIPRSDGGGGQQNIVLACKGCNSLKRSLPLLVFLLQRETEQARLRGLVGQLALLRGAPVEVISTKPQSYQRAWDHLVVVRYVDQRERQVPLKRLQFLTPDALAFFREKELRRHAYREHTAAEREKLLRALAVRVASVCSDRESQQSTDQEHPVHVGE